MPDLNPKPIPLPPPAGGSLPFREPLNLPGAGNGIYGSRRPPINPINRRPQKLKLGIKFKPDGSLLPSQPTGRALGGKLRRKAATKAAPIPVLSKVPGLGTLQGFYTLVDIMETLAPHVHRWLREQGGELEVISTPIFKGGQCVGTNYLIVLLDPQGNPNYSINSGDAGGYWGAITNIEIYQGFNQVRVLVTSATGIDGQTQATFDKLVSSGWNADQWSIGSLEVNFGGPDICGDSEGVIEPAPSNPVETQTRTPRPGTPENPIPVVVLPPNSSPSPVLPTVPNGEIIDAEIIPDSNTEDARIPGDPAISEDEEEGTPIPDPTPVPQCSDPCLAPIAKTTTQISDKLDVLERISDIVSELAESNGLRQVNQKLDELQAVANYLERVLGCLEYLYCEQGEALAVYESCDSSSVEVYSRKVQGISGLVGYLNKLDEFNQKRFKELCSGESSPEDVEPSLILSATSTLGGQIFDSGLLPNGIKSARVDIVDYWDDRNGTRVYKRDNSGLVNASFGVVSVGYRQTGKTYYLESNNLSFDSLLIDIPKFISSASEIRLSMPVGTEFQLWDTGQRQ